MAPTAASTSSTEAGPSGRLVRVGTIVGAHGLRGELRVRSDCTDALRAAHWPVRLSRREGAPDPEAHAIGPVRPGRPGECRLSLDGVTDRDAAEALRGCGVWLDAADLPPLPPGEYYQHELVGLRAQDAGGRELGVVRGIWETGAPDLLVIEDALGRERLVPAAEALLRDVDLTAGRVVIDLPPGLLEED